MPVARSLCPATIAVAFLLLPLLGLLVRAPWRSLDRVLAESQVVDALRLSLICASAATVAVAGVRGAAGVGACPGTVPGSRTAARPGHPAARTAAGCRWCRAAAGLRPQRHRRAVPRLLVRLHAAVHHPRGGRGRDVRRHAVPHRHRRRRLPQRRPRLRGGRRHPGRVAADGVPARHAAADRAVPGGRVGAVLGTRARRVRRHDHLRGQLPGPHPDDADRGLPRARTRPARPPSRSRWCCWPCPSRSWWGCATGGSTRGPRRDSQLERRLAR